MYKFNRTGTEPTALYSFKGLASIRAAHDSADFMVETATEPHEDGTVRIVEMLFNGRAMVEGQLEDGTPVWYREDDDVARGAIAKWLESGEVEKARELSRVQANK